MPRKKLIRSSHHPYHVTARGNNREVFPLSLAETWQVMVKLLSETSELYGAQIHAFVLMPNHFHLLISTPERDLGAAMHYFMLSISKEMNARSGRSGRIFGARYHWSIIMSDAHYDCALKYVYRNPVKAGLAERVEHYPYSTLLQVLGHATNGVPLRPHCGASDFIPNRNSEGFLEWLNEPFQTDRKSVV